MSLERDLLDHYANLKTQEKALKKEIEDLQESVKNVIESKKADKIETDLGSFSLIRKKKWQYSPRVTEHANQLKLFKEEEEQSGVATFDEETTLVFKAKREAYEDA